MTDVPLLALDIANNLVAVALPASLWAALFYLAWEHGPFAESLGLGRRVFWLLLPGALLASFADLPIAPVSIDWLAIDLGGALFPLIVGGLALRRYAPPAGRALTVLLTLTGLEAVVLLAVVWPSMAPTWAGVGAALHVPGNVAVIFVVAAVAAAFVAAVVTVSVSDRPVVPRRVGYLFGLVSGVLVLTFVGSTSVPSAGIEEAFPYYLLPPACAGILASMLSPWVFPGEDAFALPAAFFATTLGVLVGADVLRQPPLYGAGPAGLYSIGGAGVFDLVYLSGLLALAFAALTYLRLERGWAPVGTPIPPVPRNPVALLRDAYRAGVSGDLSRSLAASTDAARSAAARAHRLLGLAPAPAERPWEGLPVPGWIVSDHQNMESAARSAANDPREAFRAWLTARWLVVAGHQISRRRYASTAARLAAVAIDLILVTVPALLVFAAIAHATPGDLVAVASSVPFNAAVFGFVAVALLYFVLSEALVGATVGKRCVGIEVRDRDLERPDGLTALVRNVSLAPMLTVLGVGVAIAAAVALKGTGTVHASLFGVGVPSALMTDLGVASFVLGGVVVVGGIGVLVMALTPERQRVGDLWAGTRVVRELTERRADAAAPGATARAPPAEGRSG